MCRAGEQASSFQKQPSAPVPRHPTSVSYHSYSGHKEEEHGYASGWCARTLQPLAVLTLRFHCRVDLSLACDVKAPSVCFAHTIACNVVSTSTCGARAGYLLRPCVYSVHAEWGKAHPSSHSHGRQARLIVCVCVHSTRTHACFLEEYTPSCLHFSRALHATSAPAYITRLCIHRRPQACKRVAHRSQ